MMLRDMNIADVNDVLRIEQQVHDYPWTRGNFTDALDSGYLCKVFEQGGAMLGFVIMMIAPDEMQLLDLGIAAAYQRRGLGRRLLAEAMKIAREMDMRRILLEVRPSNVAAQGLYFDAGFREIGLRRGYYPAANGREDAIVMEREL
ncbi:MAG: ribosomal protein S18-alanine N-acetyltransferase [Gallionellaceae bacterium]